MNAARGRTPPGVYLLAVTEVWERFSYYGMRALLVLYMTKHLMIAQAHASQIYGLYTASIWLSLLPGGWLSDRFLGRRRSVLIGGSIMAVGHFMMAFEPLFFPALATIVVGNGLFKPNISTQVGDLYDAQDPGRDRGYGVFYVGINLGSFIAPLVCGTVGEVWGWHWGFGLAGVGMVAGLATYALGARWLPPEPVRAVAGAPAAAPVAGGTPRRIALLLAIALASGLFWICTEQAGNTMALWSDTYTDRLVSLGGFSFTIPATWAQSVNGLVIISATPVLVEFWRRQAAKGRDLGTLDKMVVGAALAGVACLIMAVAATHQAAIGAPVSWLWVVAFFVVITVGEIYLAPMSLSVFSRAAPPNLTSTIMGVYFLSLFVGSLSAGLLGGLWSSVPKPIYFVIIGGLGFLSAGLLWLLSRAFGHELEQC